MAGKTLEEYEEFVKSAPFFGKIQVGDWVHYQVVHNYQMPHHPKPEKVAVCTRIIADGKIIHVEDPVYSGTTYSVGIRNVINVSSPEAD